MAAVTVCSDLELKKIKSVTVSIFSPFICHKMMGPDAMTLDFWMLSFKPALSLSFFIFIKRLFSSSSLSALRVVGYLHVWGYWYFFWQSWFQLVLHPAWHVAWCTLYISLISRVTIYSLMYSFPNLEPVSCSMSGSNCCFLIHIEVSQETGKVVWYSHLLKNFPQFVVIHTVKSFSVVNEQKYVSLEFPWM